MSKKTVTTSELKARCSQVIDEVEKGHGPVIVTRRGKAVAEIVSVIREPPRLFGLLRGTVTIHGDLIEPVGVPWEADE